MAIKYFKIKKKGSGGVECSMSKDITVIYSLNSNSTINNQTPKNNSERR